MSILKKILLLMIPVLMAISGVSAEDAENSVDITMTIGDLVIPAKLNNTEAAKDLLSRLPYTVRLNRGSVDFCGSIEPLKYAPEDMQDGWEYGDFMWMPDGDWFVIFTDGMETYGQGKWLVLGHMDDVWEQLKDMKGSIEIKIDLAETDDSKILVQVGDVVRSATLSDNASAEAFRDLLAEGPVTIDMHDYGSFEKVGPLGRSIVRSDEPITTKPGDIILYLGNNVTIYYDVNSWDFTLLGHVDDATGENMREFLGSGNPTVTFSLP